jgi:hypothetical protein
LCRHLHGTTCSFNFFFRVKRNFIDNEFVIKICICSCYLFVELVKAIHQFLFRFTFRFWSSSWVKLHHTLETFSFQFWERNRLTTCYEHLLYISSWFCSMFFHIYHWGIHFMKHYLLPNNICKCWINRCGILFSCIATNPIIWHRYHQKEHRHCVQAAKCVLKWWSFYLSYYANDFIVLFFVGPCSYALNTNPCHICNFFWHPE